jgi:hypothetical protein
LAQFQLELVPAGLKLLPVKVFDYQLLANPIAVLKEGKQEVAAPVGSKALEG